MQRNQRKVQVLRAIASFNSCYAQDLINQLALEPHHLRALLRHYYKLGLLKREITNEGKFIYWLSEKGEKRLRWLEGSEKWRA